MRSKIYHHLNKNVPKHTAFLISIIWFSTVGSIMFYFNTNSQIETSYTTTTVPQDQFLPPENDEKRRIIDQIERQINKALIEKAVQSKEKQNQP